MATDPLFEAINSDRRLRAVVEDVVTAYRYNKERDEAVVEILTEKPATPDELEQLRRHSELRRRFLSEVPTLKSSQIAELTGSTARNSSAKASRWKAEGRIFSVKSNGVDLYPSFQFSATGEPLPELREILRLFEAWPEWTIALWFFSANAWLPEERTPLEVFASDRAAVVEAARKDSEPFEF